MNDEIKFGDNDTLGALVANLVEADALIILTDQKGLFTADPRKDPEATFVHEARAGDVALEEARKLTRDNPAAVANIVKTWINGEAPA